MLALMQKIISSVIGKTKITEDTDFVKDLELTSFDIMNLVSAFEDHYGVTIATRDVWHLHTVRDAMEYIKKRERELGR